MHEVWRSDGALHGSHPVDLVVSGSPEVTRGTVSE